MKWFFSKSLNFKITFLLGLTLLLTSALNIGWMAKSQRSQAMAQAHNLAAEMAGSAFGQRQ